MSLKGNPSETGQIFKNNLNKMGTFLTLCQIDRGTKTLLFPPALLWFSCAFGLRVWRVGVCASVSNFSETLSVFYAECPS